MIKRRPPNHINPKMQITITLTEKAMKKLIRDAHRNDLYKSQYIELLILTND